MAPRHFDTLIVGAGSAGCVLARRLSETGAGTVGLIEAGGPPDDPAIADPAQWPFIQGRAYDWAYVTKPQPGTANRRHPWPRGKVLGGSSCLHAMAHVRGHRSDFDAWAAAGGPGWSFDALLPFFKRSERFSGGASALHGADGPLDVVLPDSAVHPLVRDYMAAAESLGFPKIGDHNGPSMIGTAPNSLTIRNGRRASNADAYLPDGGAGLAALTVLTGIVVDHIAIEAGRATAVEVVEVGARRRIEAGRVVLCAGTIASPLILMRSGIGPATELAAHGIACTIDNPAVGGNLHDHLLAAGNLYAAARPVAPSRLQHSESLLYAERDPALPGPSVAVACVVLPAVSECFEAPPVGQAYSLLHGVTKPASRGRLSLGGAGPLDPPRLDPAYLTEAIDRRRFRDALALAREIGHAPALAPWREREILPGPGVTAEAEIDAFIARAAITHHHPVGTCRMGPPGDGVVDGDLAVHGVDGLFVADASIMPEITTGPINAAITALAERAADLLAGRPA
ncbi:MAG: GMC family oxidoreductase N-terminal domain-containing protein [Azospirillaceae bacterium]